VAGVQLSNNKMLHIGDWITMPKYNTDGTVLDIPLLQLKVRNFDNSVSCVPTYVLIPILSRTGEAWGMQAGEG